MRKSILYRNHKKCSLQNVFYVYINIWENIVNTLTKHAPKKNERVFVVVVNHMVTANKRCYEVIYTSKRK